MTTPAVLLKYLRQAVMSPPLAGMTDARLLALYSAGGPTSEAAFELIVRRHGPTVLRVCRAALGDDLADDAFQATFLVLVRRAGAARRAGALGPWLFGVARRVCAAARRSAAQRVRHEGRAAVLADAAVAGPQIDPDVVALVHAEVGRLPAHERAAVVLCDLAGLTYAEAGDRLGLSHAAVRGRLARARDRLRRRLGRRGIRPETIWAVPVAVPPALAGATARAAMVVAGRATGAVPVPVAELVAGGLESMIWTKGKAAALAALTAGVLFAGAVGLSARQQPGAQPRAGEAAAGSSAAVGTYKIMADPDPGDEVAALVRKAQRQQDRGDAAGALRTLKEVDVAAKQWRQQLVSAGVRTDMERQLGLELGARAGGPGRQAGEPKRLTEVEDRLAAVEAKLDRLLQKLEADGAGQTPRRGSAGPGTPKLPRADTRPEEFPPKNDFQREKPSDSFPDGPKKP